MCSIVGYIGKGYCRSIVMQGLMRLEHRGYDSAGFVCLNPQDNRLIYTKTQGSVKNLINNLNDTNIDGFIAIGHTRWSIHGRASTENTHPHFDCNKNIALMHNGIIENYKSIKKDLEIERHIFCSQTDTEVVSHLLESLLNYNSLKDSLLKLVNILKGAYSLAFLIKDYPDTIVVVRKTSPMFIGISEDEVFISSDIMGFSDKSNKVLSLKNESFALIKKDSIELYDFSGNKLDLNFDIIDVNFKDDNKSKYFMLKEIYEQKKIIRDIVYKLKEFDNLFEKLNLDNRYLKNLNTIYIAGYGSSFNIANIAKIFFETIANVETRVYLFSELKHVNFIPKKNSIAIIISQEGENQGAIDSLKFFNEQNIFTIAVTNLEESSLVKESKGQILVNIKEESFIATNKLFLAQLSNLYLFANKIAFEKNIITKEALEESADNLLFISELIEGVIEDNKDIISNEFALKYSKFKNYLFLGRGISYPVAMEAALKIKEIMHIFSHTCPAGELKHGLLNLINKDLPICIFSSVDDLIYQKLISTAKEIKSRNGNILSFVFKDQKDLIDLSDYYFIIPRVKPLFEPFVLITIMQFFIHNIAQISDKNLDINLDLNKNESETEREN